MATAKSINVSLRVIADLSQGLYRSPADAFKELISNAYDADSPGVEIIFSKDFSTITINDKGKGMSTDDFIRVMETIGGSSKRSIDSDNKEKTPSGRKIVGRIGIGLLSVSQIANKLEIKSTVNGSSKGLEASIEFDQFASEEAKKIKITDLWEEKSQIEIGKYYTKEGISNKKSKPVLSLFSGGGLLDLGFINQGFQISEAIEIEPEFIKAYNYAVKRYLENSTSGILREEGAKYKAIIAPINASSRKEQESIAERNKDITGIIGGPPCQDYSVGGGNAGIEGKKGKLIYSYLSIVKQIKPSFLFFENVEGLYRTTVHKKAFLRFVRKIEKEGYYVWHNVLNILDYGYAQDRPRIVLVAFKKQIVNKLVNAGYVFERDHQKLENGIRKAVFKWPDKLFVNPKEIDWPEKWGFRSGIRTADLEDIPEEFERLRVINAFEGLNYSTPNQREYFNPKSDKFNFIDEGDTDRKSFKRLHRYRYSPTVAYGNNEVHLHPTKARRLTVREALRLQSVPDTYVLPKNVPLTYKFKLISNGVPTALAELVAKEIKRTLNIYYKIQSKNGHLVKGKKKLSNVQNPVKKYQTGKTASLPLI